MQLVRRALHPRGAHQTGAAQIRGGLHINRGGVEPGTKRLITAASLLVVPYARQAMKETLSRLPHARIAWSAILLEARPPPAVLSASSARGGTAEAPGPPRPPPILKEAVGLSL